MKTAALRRQFVRGCAEKTQKGEFTEHRRLLQTGNGAKSPAQLVAAEPGESDLINDSLSQTESQRRERPALHRAPVVDLTAPSAARDSGTDPTDPPRPQEGSPDDLTVFEVRSGSLMGRVVIRQSRIDWQPAGHGATRRASWTDVADWMTS